MHLWRQWMYVCAILPWWNRNNHPERRRRRRRGAGRRESYKRQIDSETMRFTKSVVTLSILWLLGLCGGVQEISLIPIIYTKTYYVHLWMYLPILSQPVGEETQKESLLFKLCIFCVIYFKTTFFVVVDWWFFPNIFRDYEQHCKSDVVCMCM